MRFCAPTDTDDTDTVSSARSTPARSTLGTTAQGRKIPECRTCGTPMRGHKRDPAGSPICPSLPSPAPSPDRNVPGGSYISTRKTRRSSATTPPPTDFGENGVVQRSPLRRSPGLSYIPHQFAPASPLHPGPRMEPSFELPVEGTYHRSNPNYTNYLPTPKRETPYVNPNPKTRANSEVPSEVPTVLCDDDGNTIYAGEESERSIARRLLSRSESTETETPSTLSRVGTWLHSPALTLYRAHGTDIQSIQTTAHHMGVHTAVLPAAQPLSREESFWLLMGNEPAFVRQILDAFQKGMPGGLNGGAVDSGVVEGPRMVSFLQLVIAAMLGGCVVIFGLGYVG